MIRICDRIQKGTRGYRAYRKKIAVLSVLGMGIVVMILFFTGLFIYRTRMNVWTVSAVVACLPFAKTAVSLIIRLPYRSVDAKEAAYMDRFRETAYILFDLLLTSPDRTIPLDIAAVTDSHVYGLIRSSDRCAPRDKDFIEKELRSRSGNQYSIRLYYDIQSFYSCMEKRMKREQEVTADNTNEKRRECVRVLLSISL